jgi:hypothetical protein
MMMKLIFPHQSYANSLSRAISRSVTAAANNEKKENENFLLAAFNFKRRK